MTVKPPLPTPKPLPPAVPMRDSMPEWFMRLKEAGYPTDVVMIDFETFTYDTYSLRKQNMSTVEYVTDARFEALGASVIWVKQPFEEPNPRWIVDVGSFLETLKDNYGPDLAGCTIVAHNLGFESMILLKRYGIKPKYMIDLLGLARHLNARAKNDLGTLCRRYNLPAKGGTKQFLGCTHRRRLAKVKGRKRKNAGPPKFLPLMTEEQEFALAEYANNDALQQWQLFVRIFPTLSNFIFELAVMDHTFEMWLRPKIMVDFAFGEDLVKRMEVEMERVAGRLDFKISEISGTNSFIAILGAALAETGEKVPMKQGKPTNANPSGLIPAIAKDDEPRKALLAHKNPRVVKLMKAKAAMKSWPLHIKRVNKIMAQARAAGGYLHVMLKYHGAHTGRWAGGEKINLQNLPSRGKIALILEMRKLLIAPPDHELVIADASQVEARGVAWIAQQEDLCELFRQGVEIYCVYAEKMVGRKLRKSRKTDPPPVKAYYDRNRNMGKVQVLGCGYGMGGKKCKSFAASAYDVKLTADEAKKLVDTYREACPKVVQFWNDIEQAFKYTCRFGKPCKLRNLSFRKDGTTTIIVLPNGRELKYKDARVSLGSKGDEISMPHPMKPGSKIHMWGGYLTENVVQAFCRDFLAGSVLAMEKQGMPVALLVHDELIGVVPKGTGETWLTKTNKELATPPDWAAGCPLGSEGKVALRYGK